MPSIEVVDCIQSQGQVTDVFVRLGDGQTFQGKDSYWLTWDDFLMVRDAGRVEIIDSIGVLA